MPSDEIENVLILQGGGSLGAFACGVFKTFVENNIKIDIVAGTSIGAVNASIISGSKQVVIIWDNQSTNFDRRSCKKYS